jgi:hypothetical protein
MVTDKEGQKAFLQTGVFYRLNNFILNSFFSTQLLDKNAKYIKRMSMVWNKDNFNAGILL